MDDMKFSDKVDRLREARGITSQAALGELIGVPQPVISEWSRKGPDQIRLNLTQLHALGKVLDASLEYLTDDTADTPPPPAVTADERVILDVLRALRLPKDEAIRRLSGSPVVRAASPESEFRVDHFNDRDSAPSRSAPENPAARPPRKRRA